MEKGASSICDRMSQRGMDRSERPPKTSSARLFKCQQQFAVPAVMCLIRRLSSPTFFVIAGPMTKKMSVLLL